MKIYLNNVDTLEQDHTYNLSTIKKKIKEIKSKTAICKGDDFFLNKKEYENAISCYKEAIYFNGNDFFTYHKLALCFNELHNSCDSAILYLNKSMSLNNNFDENYRVLGDIHYDKQLLSEAVDYYEKYACLNQKNPYLYNRLGHIYGLIGYTERSALNFKRAFAIKPDYAMALTNFNFVNLRLRKNSQKDIYNTTKTLVDNYLKAIKLVPNNNQKYENILDKNKKLRIGYLSSNIRYHVLMKFMRPVFENHDKSKLHIICYSNAESSDRMTDIIKSCSDEFKVINPLTDKEVADLIRNDKIDILVDLDGHAGYNRLFILAYKPAPIQVTYHEFPNTTGLSTIDYILFDKLGIQEGEEKYFTEKPFYLDFAYECYKSFEERDNYPFTTPLPALENNYITFGYFNCLTKTDNSLIKLWSKILKSVPGSKLLIHRTSLDSIRQKEFYEQFMEFGIDKDRLILLNDKKNFDVIRARTDLSFDSPIYNGFNITIESILVGVPVISIIGDGPHRRGTARINYAIGCPELIAKDEDEYVQIAIDLANNIEKLKEYRATLRDKFLNSVYFDYENFTKCLERAYIQMWNDHCDKASKR